MHLNELSRVCMPKNEVSTSYGSKVIAKVKVQSIQRDKQAGQKQNAPIICSWGIKIKPKPYSLSVTETDKQVKIYLQPEWQHPKECMCCLQNSDLRLPRKCDYRTDRQKSGKVIPMCRYASQATQTQIEFTWRTASWCSCCTTCHCGSDWQARHGYRGYGGR